MTHLRGKALSPTAALPLLSPPCFAAHVLHRRLSAQPQSDKSPAPADLHHPSRPTPSVRGSGALWLRLFRTVFRQQTKSPKAEGVRSRPILSISAEAHQNTTTPFRRKNPAESAQTRPARADSPRRRNKRCGRHGMASVLQVRATQRSLSPMRRNGRMFPLLLHASGHPAQKLPRQKTPPRSPPLAAAANRRTPFGALPHFDKTPRSAARGPAVTPAVAAPSFRSDLAPESAAGRIVQP